ncbi:MAG: hypothetical protein NDJ90_08410 [Oligoflexia bacterium]|nr:hypothetical protein [Oligoflexia bacterium]
MKNRNLISLALASLLLLATSSWGGLTVRTTDCARQWGPTEQNLAIEFDSSEDLVLVGFSQLGVFFDLKMENCKVMSLKNRALACDGVTMGGIGAFYPGEGGIPTAKLTLDPRMEFSINGSCRSEKRRPLSLHVDRFHS